MPEGPVPAGRRSRRLDGIWLGRRDYRSVHALQLELHEARRRNAIPDTVLLLEHDPVITMGRGADPRHLLLTPEVLAARGIDVVKTGRGGDVTLHAPGQLICYPIVDLNPDRRDVRRYVNDLTQTMRALAKHYEVDAGEHSAYIGLWADAARPNQWRGEANAQVPEKLGAIGVRISRWVTMHGFAFNLTTSLDLFENIVPCGISGLGVTSIARLTGRTPAVEQAADLALYALASALQASLPAQPPRTHRGELTLEALAS